MALPGAATDDIVSVWLCTRLHSPWCWNGFDSAGIAAACSSANFGRSSRGHHRSAQGVLLPERNLPLWLPIGRDERDAMRMRPACLEGTNPIVESRLHVPLDGAPDNGLPLVRISRYT